MPASPSAPRTRELWTPLAADRLFVAVLAALGLLLLSHVRGTDINPSWSAALPASLALWLVARWWARARRRHLRLRVAPDGIEQEWPRRRTIPYAAITHVAAQREIRGSSTLIIDFMTAPGRAERDAVLWLSHASAANFAAEIEARRAGAGARAG